MKKLFWILLPTLIFAQRKDTQVKINTLTAPLGIANIGIEHALTDNITLQADALISPWKSFADNHLQIYMGFLEGRYYFNSAMNKFYVGPNIGLGFFDIQKWNYWNTNKYQRGVAFVAGATVGYQFQINEHWGIDAFIGGGHSEGNYKGYRKDIPERYDSAQIFNKSGEWLIYRGGVMLTYKFKRKNK
jgi:hypothetical protein